MDLGGLHDVGVNDIHIDGAVLAQAMGLLMHHGVASPSHGERRTSVLKEWLGNVVGVHAPMLDSVTRAIECRVNALNEVIKSGAVSPWVVIGPGNHIIMTETLVHAAATAPLTENVPPSFVLDEFRALLLAHTEPAGHA